MVSRAKTMMAILVLGLADCGSPERGEQASACGDPIMTRETQAAMSPRDALERLKEGNERFVSGRSLRRDFPMEAHATARGQFPFAAIVSCLDSRVSPELVFDQGLGDLFCARVAGNILNDDILGSLEFAAQVSGAKLIVVMGHSSCGAVKGACDGVELGHLTGLLNKIEPAVKVTLLRKGGPASGKDPSFVDEVARENVRRTVQALLETSPILKELVNRGTVNLKGGFQDLSSGRVTFLD